MSLKKITEPTAESVKHYLRVWDELENYRLQESALDHLFFELCPNNSDIRCILLKVSTLNDFYSTNIFSVYPVAKHILSLNIDRRLRDGDETLVDEIKEITIGGKKRNLYSFATKYCSHHNPLAFPIYDSYVDKVLKYFRDRDHFYEFRSSDLKNYGQFICMLISFREYYGLKDYSLKDIDKFLWLFGKEFFPRSYG